MQVQVSLKGHELDSTRDLYKIFSTIVLVIVISIPLMLGTRLLIPLPRDVQITVIIDRYAENESDWTAIRIAELTNFSVLFDIPPFETTSGDTYTPSIQWETWFHYINNQTLDHYLNRSRFGTQYHYNLHITLNYTARCFYASNLSVDVDDYTIQVSNGATLITYRLSEYVHFDESRWVQWTNGSYYSGAEGSGIPHEMSANYGSGYFLYMGLDHSEWWDPLAAFGPHVDQFVIMNATYHILFATAIEEGHWVA